MPLYMTQFAYTPEALATLAENPQDRSAPCASSWRLMAAGSSPGT